MSWVYWRLLAVAGLKRAIVAPLSAWLYSIFELSLWSMFGGALAYFVYSGPTIFTLFHILLQPATEAPERYLVSDIRSPKPMSFGLKRPYTLEILQSRLTLRAPAVLKSYKPFQPCKPYQAQTRQTLNLTSGTPRQPRKP